MSATPTRRRRSYDERIADLEAQLAKMKAQAERKKVKKDPSLKHVSSALRSVEKALSLTEDVATKTALVEAGQTLSACLALHGVTAKGRKGTLRPVPRRGAAVEAEQVLDFLERHPGARSEEMAGELGTDTAGLRPVLSRLREEGRIRTEGKARATRYSLVDG